MPTNTYETSKLVNEYLLFHYGTADEILPYGFGPKDALDFAVRCVSECVDKKKLKAGARGLDVGCAVGRSTFELSRYCSEVIGIDYSQSFIDTAQDIAENGVHYYSRVDEGTLETDLTIVLDKTLDRERVSFMCGDAHELDESLEGFDVVLACNLICRLEEPMKFLQRLPALVKPGGQLVITTPFTWLETFTHPSKWLGGTVEKGDSMEGLSDILSPDFRLKAEKDLPFLIREHARKFQWSVAQATIWERKA